MSSIADRNSAVQDDPASKLGWDLVIDPEKGTRVIVGIRKDGKYCAGNWPYDEKNELERRVLAGELEFKKPTLSAEDAAVQRKQRRQLLRHQRLQQFEQQQLKSREWISFAEIIDWRSRDRKDGSLDVAKRKGVLSDLDSYLATGWFIVDGRSQVMFLSPEHRIPKPLLNVQLSTRWRFVTSDQWVNWKSVHGLQTLHDQILHWCWIPREVCLRWCANVPFEPKPEWLNKEAIGISTKALGEIANPTIATPGMSKAKRKYNRNEAKAFVFRELDRHGDIDEEDQNDNWSCLADIERALHDHFENRPAESTVRLWAKRYLQEWRDQRGRNQ